MQINITKITNGWIITAQNRMGQSPTFVGTWAEVVAYITNFPMKEILDQTMKPNIQFPSSEGDANRSTSDN